MEHQLKEGQCHGKKVTGGPCQHQAREGSLFCGKHDPDYVPDEKSPTTKPWDADNNPWSLDMLRLNKRRKDFRPRFVDKANIEKKLDQGWKVAHKKDWGGTTAKLPGEEGEQDTIIRRRELVLMEMPEESAKKRDEYIAWKTNRATEATMQAADKAAAEVKRETGQDPRLTRR